MSILKVTNTDLSKISVETPAKSDDLYLSTVKYNNQTFVLQTSKFKIIEITDDSINVEINDGMVSFLTQIDKHFIHILSDNSEEWFSKKYSKNKIAQIYKNSYIKDLDTENFTMNVKLSDNLQIYDHNKNILESKDLQIGMTVILLISIPYLVFYQSNSIPYWDCLHIKIKNDQPKPDYTFRETNDKSDVKLQKPKIDKNEFNF
jgi:hypothetical protein